MWKQLRFGVALGGGAARGVSHIGVLEVLEDAGLGVDVIAGTSMGALVGAIYLLEGSAARLTRRLYEIIESDAFRAAHFEILRERKDDDDDQGFLESLMCNIKKGMLYSYSVTRQSMIEREVYDNLMNSLLPDINIEDLPKPFCAASLDVVTGEEIIWTKGSLRQAVAASCAIPGIFPPQEINGRVLVDGGWTNSVPVRPARKLGADLVAAVDISRIIEEMLEYRRGVNVVMRAAVLTSKYIRQMQLEEADWIITPKVGHIHWADFREVDHLISLGHDAALTVVSDIRKRMRKRRVFNLFGRRAAIYF